MIVGIVQAAGIPAYRPGGSLTDEFAMSQQLMNLQGVRVYVPGNRLEEARKALEEADASGELLEDERHPDSTDAQ